jgi:glutamine amidotransferase
MCRLFGFRSVLESGVHQSLLTADNALAVQSCRHPDGWGVAYYLAGAPHVIRSTGTALNDRLFKRVSGVVTSQTVVAHVRKATQGELSPLNCHPFQHGRWVLAHNGDVPEFGEVRDALVDRIAPRLRGFLLGDTDSEVIFHLFLTHLVARVDPSRRGAPVGEVVAALRDAVADVREVADARGLPSSLLTLLVTDGELMVAHQGGKDLFWSSHKTGCQERGSCPFFAPECEAPSRSGYVNHLLLASEPLHGENVWTAMAPGEVVGVDGAMRLFRQPAP